MKRLFIISIDPGGTTGISSYYVVPYGSPRNYSESFSGLQLGPKPHFKQLWEFLTGANPDIIICENFDAQDSPAVKMISLEYIGVVKLYCELTGTQLHMRPRAFKDVKWVDNSALEKMGVYATDAPHRNDATRHLVHFVVTELKHKDILRGLRKVVE